MKRAASARGLFRATGNKSKPVAIQMLDGSFAKAEHLDRKKDDFYPTPIEPIRAILHAEQERLTDFPTLWEPAAGDGVMVHEFEGVGFEVLASDLVDRGCNAEIKDFYDYKSSLAPAIITNPPFCELHKKAPWVTHALDVLGIEYMALLMPFGWPGAMDRAELWATNPPARVYLMRWRIDFTGQGAPPMLNAWFVWDKKHVGETVLRMLDRADSRQSEMFGVKS